MGSLSRNQRALLAFAHATLAQATAHGLVPILRTCVWSRGDDDTDKWEGSCGVAWSLSEGTPADNGMNYCPRCGAKLEQAKDGGA